MCVWIQGKHLDEGQDIGKPPNLQVLPIFVTCGREPHASSFEVPVILTGNRCNRLEFEAVASSDGGPKHTIFNRSILWKTKRRIV